MITPATHPKITSVSGNIIKIHEINERNSLAMEQRYKLPTIIARLLDIRGSNVESTARFLNPKIKNEIQNPAAIKDMDKAVNRIIQAIENNEKIAIFGDYDVDGATSSALLNLYLKNFGIESIVHIPDRIKEGYGPNKQALDKLADMGATLCITVDCGTLAHEPLEHAEARGMNIIVIDHHIGSERVPQISALINPNRIDGSNPEYSGLAAVGVTFLVLIMLNSTLRNQDFFEKSGIMEPNLMKFLDLVALGTVCDVMQLTGLNRAFVKQGLTIINRRNNIGISALLDIININGKIESSHLGFALGPRINAGGRIGIADLGTRLLSTGDHQEASEIAQQLDEFNQARRILEEEALSEAIAQVNDPGNFIMVIGDWHPGIIGILASRLKDRFKVPTAVGSSQGIDEPAGMIKVSARSVPGLDIGNIILEAKMKNLITEGGGHAAAGGFSITPDKEGELSANPNATGFATLEEKLNILKEFISNKCSEAGLKIEHTMKVDAIVDLDAINVELWNNIQTLSPLGMGNPTPKFILRNVNIANSSIIKDKHIKCIVYNNFSKKRLSAIAFNSADTNVGQELLRKRLGNCISLVGTIQQNNWNNREDLQFMISDVITEEI